ncbi:MAG TPA: Lrp/AsnC family transcriptional regulator [Steroidobacteraceae bacterium]|jgi:Lrp/AsnC family transcriptional regulator of ectoine degradation|nr:Lrp/AsnC family transcriptional regulator [Steroidobacteraceae bacterium]
MSKASKKSKPTDRLDMRILTALSERGRQTLTELSKTVGLSATPCGARVEHLEAHKVILGYHADVDIEGIADLSPYFVTIAANPYSAELARKLEALMLASPYIVSADALFGSIDYILRVYARSTQHYHAIMAPFVALGVDYETWPVSRRVMTPKVHRLIAHLASEGG